MNGIHSNSGLWIKAVEGLPDLSLFVKDEDGIGMIEITIHLLLVSDVQQHG